MPHDKFDTTPFKLWDLEQLYENSEPLRHEDYGQHMTLEFLTGVISRSYSSISTKGVAIACQDAKFQKLDSELLSSPAIVLSGRTLKTCRNGQQLTTHKTAEYAPVPPRQGGTRGGTRKRRGNPSTHEVLGGNYFSRRKICYQMI
jgi:hypothetical protein